MTAEKYQLLPALPMHIAALHLRSERLGPRLFVTSNFVGVGSIASEVAHCALRRFFSPTAGLLLNPNLVRTELRSVGLGPRPDLLLAQQRCPLTAGHVRDHETAVRHCMHQH